MIHFTLYSRGYCHLCDDMLLALESSLGDHVAGINVVDVDLDPGLVDLYDERVPVLTGRRSDGDVIELCHYFLDGARVQAFLQGLPLPDRHHP